MSSSSPARPPDDSTPDPALTSNPPGYPAEWETHAVLSDGAPVELRPIRPDDRNLLDAFHRRQSSESIYFRFFRHRPELSDSELEFFTRVDYVDRMAFVALLGNELVAVARYEQVSGSDRPELAFFVDDAHQGRGLATLLLEYLAAAARSRGLSGFTATVLAENYAMLGVFKRAGFDVKSRFEDGLIGVEIGIEVTAGSAEAIARRHTRARSKSVARLLRPSSVAVVGAGRNRGGVGHELFRSVIDGGFTGEVFAVNHAADEVLGRRTWPSLRVLAEERGSGVDLVIVAVPADAVEDVVTEAAEVGVGGLLIVTSGFSETGIDGAERERRLVSLARSNGMRLIGPNSFGLVNNDPETQLRALFLDVGPAPGSVALLSQSGPLGGAVLRHMQQRHIGISSFVAVGNRADVSVNDVLDYWLTDDATDVALLYVENYGNLRTFARTARSLSATKPVVTVRPPDDNLVELLGQAGVILVDGVAAMADVARLAADQPLPAGSRVAVVSNTASVARLAVSACRRSGLEVVVPDVIRQDPAPGTRVEDSILVGDVDTILVSGSDERPDYERVLVATSVSAEVDAVLVALVPTLELGIADLAALLARVNRSIDKPLVATGLVADDELSVAGLPIHEFPEEAARTLGLVATYARWRRDEAANSRPLDDADLTTVAAEIRPALALPVDDEPDAVSVITQLSPEAPALVEAIGLPVAPWRVVEDRDRLDRAGAELGYPVVLKARNDGRRTVGEAGGAAIDLHDGGQLAGAFDRMLAGIGVSMLPVVVQSMVPSSGNGRLELVQDPDLGAFIDIGIGGALGAAVPEARRRFLPLANGDADDMVDALDPALPLDDDSRRVLVELIERLALVASAVPELAGVVLDPILLAGPMTAVGDLRVTTRPWRRDTLAGVRRL